MEQAGVMLRPSGLRMRGIKLQPEGSGFIVRLTTLPSTHPQALFWSEWMVPIKK